MTAGLSLLQVHPVKEVSEKGRAVRSDTRTQPKRYHLSGEDSAHRFANLMPGSLP
jgi:hypothetical protein